MQITMVAEVEEKRGGKRDVGEEQSVAGGFTFVRGM